MRLQGRPFVLLLIFVVCGLGCAGPPYGAGPDAWGGAETATASYMHAITAEDGEYICEDYPDPDYMCVKSDTGEPYLCKLIDDSAGGYDYQCVADKADDPQWAPSCPDFRQVGDGFSGGQCWDPPEDYCLDGCQATQAWYCRPDASKCCLSRCADCFLCGWVEMTGCMVAGQQVAADPGLCDGIREALPQAYRDCMDTNGQGTGCGPVLDDPECEVDTSLIICPGQG